MFIATESWKSAFPGASVGVMVLRGAENPEVHPALEEHKQALEAGLRHRYAGMDRRDFATLPPIVAYANYYRAFSKTYHVQLQLESLVLKNKSIPPAPALVKAMFMAELDNLLLTAGHDLAAVHPPLSLRVSQGGEEYVLMRGDPQQLKPHDMYICDQAGILSSIIYGPDARTRILPSTRDVLYTVYAPVGIDRDAVRKHLEQIQGYVRLFAPQAQTELLEVYP